MATTRIMPLHTGKGRSVGNAIRDILDYVENPDKTDRGRLITAHGCNGPIADAEFLSGRRLCLERSRRRRPTASAWSLPDALPRTIMPLSSAPT